MAGLNVNRRGFLAGTGAALAASTLPLGAQAQSTKTGVVRVWGEPGPYAGVAVNAMNEWAQKNAPGLKFEVETIPWDGVYVKLMTDLAAKKPPSLISVESPIAYQLMGEGLLTPVDDLVTKVGGEGRIIKGLKFEHWGKWKGQQFIMPAHMQPHLLLVRTDVIKELGLSDPMTWKWPDLLNAARTIHQKKQGMAGITLALGRNLCTEYHFGALLHSAGGRLFAAENKFEVVFDSPETVEALEFLKELRQFMPKGAGEYSFLQVVDAHVTGQTAMSFYWGRTLGRAAEEAKDVFQNTEAYPHAKHPKTNNWASWTDFQGWCIPAQNNPFIQEVKDALVYFQNNKDWMIKYSHSLMPNVSPVYQDIADAPEMKKHALYEAKPDSVRRFFVDAVPHSSNTGNELLKGVNPLSGIVHGRSVLAQVVQKVIMDNMPPAEAAKFGARELTQLRKENMRLIT